MQIAQGRAQPEVQDEAQVCYAEKLDKNEALLDWQQSALELDRKIRGLNAWPVAQTLYKGQVLRVWRCAVLNDDRQLAPGEINTSQHELDVGTGNGVLRLLEVQLPGGKRIAGKDFLNAQAADSVRLGL